MRSPAEMSIIQIEITNACTHRCSNCTRFCGHHRNPFFMDYPTFKNAVDSLVDFPGMVGIMGGEPTLHPQFAQLATYCAEKIKPDCALIPLTEPIKDFAAYRHLHLRTHSHKSGLWTSLGNKYYEHFELIQDVFGYQCINDHVNSGLHQALMITRKELGIPDSDWVKFRDKCWIQNLWSASITPKGAFFCEIAAALDMLFDGPGGWPIEPGWWKRTPNDSKDQLHWCEMCSAALKVPSHQANIERDIISPAMLEELKVIGSPKIEKGAFTLFNPKHYDPSKYAGNTSDGLSYLPNKDSSLRVAKTNKSIFPHALSLCPMTAAVAGIDDFTDWCAIVRDLTRLPAELENEFKSTIFNPGCAYYHIPGRRETTGASPKEIVDKAEIFIFNRRASVLMGLEKLKFGTALISRWDVGKLISLNHYPKFVSQIPKGTENLPGKRPDHACASILPKESEQEREAALIARLIVARFQHLRVLYPCIALYGAGAYTKWLLDFLTESGFYPDNMPKVIAILDDKADGMPNIHGFKVIRPSVSALKNVDAIILSTDIHQVAMKKQLEKTYGITQIPVIDLFNGLPGPHAKLKQSSFGVADFFHQFKRQCR